MLYPPSPFVTCTSGFLRVKGFEGIRGKVESTLVDMVEKRRWDTQGHGWRSSL
jgi:hypothetical protein